MKIFGRRNEAVEDEALEDEALEDEALEDEALEDEALEKGNFPAALRVAAPLLPSIAVLVTILAYLVLAEVAEKFTPGELAKLTGINKAVWEFMYGDLAVLGGLLIGLLLWFTVAWFQNSYTSAHYVSRRNYNSLRERLDNLQIRVEEAKKNVTSAESENDVLQSIRCQALALADKQCKAIDKGLKSKGMPVVTGLGYIELWHRVHRAEEALIKIEPRAEVLEGAIRDESRLLNANMENKDVLLKYLKDAVAILTIEDKEPLLKRLRDVVTTQDQSAIDQYTSVLSEPAQGSEEEKARVTPEQRAQARTKLSEIRYEINNFRDNSWEGLVNLRNRLADTVVLLGLTTYALLTLAIFLEVPREKIIWATTYFLIGAIAGLFARAQSEWGAEAAVDDFGLSKTRLLQVPWLSGLAATGGVVVTSILDPQKQTVELASVFSNRPVLLFVAAAFGITPNLLIQRFDDQADKSKEDLESTQTSQSIEDIDSMRSRLRASSRTRAR